jgi:hypothetical protein
MKVSDVINFAITSELKQLSVANIDKTNKDRSANILALISYINQGVIELYKRFGLATQSATLNNLYDGASWTMGEDYLYITYAKGNDDDESEIPINDEDADMSLFTPAPYQLFLSQDEDLVTTITEINITYMAVPPLLTKETDIVLLPVQFLEALLNYMAFKGHSSLSAQPNQDNNTYYQRFEASCQRIKNDGLNTIDNVSNEKLGDRGFV